MIKILTCISFLAVACSNGQAGALDPSRTMPQQQEPQQQEPQPTKYSSSGHDLTPLSQERKADIVAELTPMQVDVTQRAGTEPPNSSDLVREKRPGTYVSAVGGLPLFHSSAKFDSGTGWPSFTAPIDPAHVLLRTDRSLGSVRTEVLDARSGAHLGHVFDDGPEPTGKRYCMNGAALRFVPEGEPLPPESRPANLETAYFAGGCFWGVEDVFAQIPGVVDAVSGYQGGSVEQPTYEQVCSGGTGHAESVKVVFDRDKVSYRQLLRVFFANHDPTTLNRQGPDVGTQYRSAIFATSDQQETEAKAYVHELQDAPAFARRKIATRIEKAAPFWPAEAYHQDYHRKHGGSCTVK